MSPPDRTTPPHSACRFTPGILVLRPGTRLASYEIIALLGAGGMGEVYRARDRALNRDVALKVLPELFAADSERLGRFKREAQLLASLNHPHIAAIYGFEESTDVHALVLELVEGPTLADRIAEGPIPVDEALAVARQLADALEVAHDQGIIHRDLKPANIKLRPDGTVKVLDFGLAKLISPIGETRPAPSLSFAPTITSPDVTNVGTVLGTARYMSPEQAKGRDADKRSDIWAFGVVLYEMLTGRRPFDGEGTTEILAAVLRQTIDWTTLPKATPAVVKALLIRCLERDTKRRLRDIGEARIALEDAGNRPEAGIDTLPLLKTRRSRRRQAVVTIGTALAAGVLVGTTVWVAGRPAPQRLRILDLTPALAEAPSISRNQVELAITPDGSIVWVGRSGASTLFIRPPDSISPIPLFSGEPRGPFVSSDGKWVGFVDGTSELKKVPVAGGAPTFVAPVDGLPRGATWLGDTIIFATDSAATGLQRVAAEGGPVEVLTRPDHSRGERDHLWPDLLPGGRAVVFTITSLTGDLDAARIVVQDLQTGDRTELRRGVSGARYVPSGHLLYASRGTMMAAPFDVSRLRLGTAVALVPKIVTTLAGGMYGVAAADGTLAYVPQGPDPQTGPRRSLVWVDEQGVEDPILTAPQGYNSPRLTADASRLVVARNDEQQDIWVIDVAHGTPVRLTFDGAVDGLPLWMPDGRVIFSSNRTGARNLWIATEGAAMPAPLSNSPNSHSATAITPDGNRVIFTETKGSGAADVMEMELGGDRSVRALLDSAANERNAVVSPNGQWIVYESDESGRPEVFVRPYPEVRKRNWPVSTATDGGTRPLWSHTGDKLFYVSPDGALMRIDVPTKVDWGATVPVKVVKEGYLMTSDIETGRQYDVDRTGKRFLVIKRSAENTPAQPESFKIVQPWLEELKRLTLAK